MMKAPEDLVAALDHALASARESLSTHSWRDRVAPILELANEPDLGLRAIRAAVLPVGFVNDRSVDYSDTATKVAAEAYDAAVTPIIPAALALLAYEEIETYVLAHPRDPHVAALLGDPRATARMRPR